MRHTRQFYTAPTALVDIDAIPPTAHPPGGLWHAFATPGLPAVAIVLVESWNDHASQDAWEALPGVVERYIGDLGLPAPAVAITAFAPWGATTGMTLRQVLRLVQQNHPAIRP